MINVNFLFKVKNKSILSLLLFILAISSYKNTLGQSTDSPKQYKLNVYFMEDFKDTFKIYLNDKFISKNYFITNETIAACEKYITLKIDKLNNQILIKNTKNKVLFNIDFLNSPKNKYLYINRYFGHWNYELTNVFKQTE